MPRGCREYVAGSCDVLYPVHVLPSSELATSTKILKRPRRQILRGHCCWYHKLRSQLTTIVQINVFPLGQRIRINALFVQVVRIVKSLEVSIRLAFDHDDFSALRRMSNCDDGGSIYAVRYDTLHQSRWGPISR